jgi:hypothetical protein
MYMMYYQSFFYYHYYVLNRLNTTNFASKICIMHVGLRPCRKRHFDLFMAVQCHYYAYAFSYHNILFALHGARCNAQGSLKITIATPYTRPAVVTRLQGLTEQKLLILGDNSTLDIILLQEDRFLSPMYAQSIAILVVQVAPPRPLPLLRAVVRTCHSMDSWRPAPSRRRHRNQGPHSARSPTTIAFQTGVGCTAAAAAAALAMAECTTGLRAPAGNRLCASCGAP